MPSPYQYRQYYGEDVDLFGLSLAKQLLGVSVGAEVSFSYRRYQVFLSALAARVIDQGGSPRFLFTLRSAN